MGGLAVLLLPQNLEYVCLRGAQRHDSRFLKPFARIYTLDFESWLLI